MILEILAGGMVTVMAEEFKMKKIRSFSVIIICLLLSSMVFSQENNNDLRKTLKRKNTVDITVGGTGLFLSANYSRIIAVKSDYFVAASAGIGTVPPIGGITLPHQFTFNLAKKRSFLELGASGIYRSGKSTPDGIIFVMIPSGHSQARTAKRTIIEPL